MSKFNRKSIKESHLNMKEYRMRSDWKLLLAQLVCVWGLDKDLPK